MSAPNPTSVDISVQEYDHPSLSWINNDVPEVVKMAELQDNESILVLACATGALILEVAQAYDGIHGRLVGVDKTPNAVRRAREKLIEMNLLGDKELFCGNPYDIDGLREAEAIGGQSNTTFDVIFARKALPPDSSQHVSILRHWTSFLTPTSGRMIVTFSPWIDDTPSIAGIQVVNGDGEIKCQIRWILEHDWVEAENKLQALAGGTGLKVEGMKRIALQDARATDQGEEMEQQMQAAGWTGLKQDFLWQALEISTPMIGATLRAEHGEDIQVVPVLILLAVVLKKDYLIEVE